MRIKVDQSSLVNCINDLTGDDRDEAIPSALRLIDQHTLVPKYWFHPRMDGRTSIKVALPAALAVATPGRIDNWLREVGLLDPQTGSRPDNPYLLLPSLDVQGLSGEAEEADPGSSVTDGVEAMRAYQDMAYGRYMHKPIIHSHHVSDQDLDTQWRECAPSFRFRAASSSTWPSVDTPVKVKAN